MTRRSAPACTWMRPTWCWRSCWGGQTENRPLICDQAYTGEWGEETSVSHKNFPKWGLFFYKKKGLIIAIIELMIEAPVITAIIYEDHQLTKSLMSMVWAHHPRNLLVQRWPGSCRPNHHRGGCPRKINDLQIFFFFFHAIKHHWIWQEHGKSSRIHSLRGSIRKAKKKRN